MVVSIFLCPNRCFTRRMSFVLSYSVVAWWCLRFRSGIIRIWGLLSLSASRLRNLLHISLIRLDWGNGYCVVYLSRYVRSRSVVRGLSFMLLLLCLLHPCTLIMPLSASMSALFVVANSWVSMPVCSRIVKITEYFHEDALIILYMFSVVGIKGTLLSYGYLGLSYVIPLYCAK